MSVSTMYRSQPQSNGSQLLVPVGATAVQVPQDGSLPQFSVDSRERQGIFHAPVYCVQPLISLGQAAPSISGFSVLRLSFVLFPSVLMLLFLQAS